MANLVVLAAALGACVPLALGGINTVTNEVFIDVKVSPTAGNSAKEFRGRIVIGLFGEGLPMTVFNFIQLIKGYKHGTELWTYRNSIFHRIVPDFLIQTGDVLYKDGRGGRSVYAPNFIDEAFHHSHKAAGYVAMANTGVDTNQSQFYITMAPARWLDKRNVIFGKVIAGLEVMKYIAALKTNERSYPRDTMPYITDCGELPLSKPYDLSFKELGTDGDVKPHLSKIPKK